MTEAIRMLGEPRKRQILEMLADAELPVGVIAERVGLRQPTVTQHLQALRSHGLVSERREGTRRLYSSNTEALLALRAEVEAFWVSALPALKHQGEQAPS